MINVCRPRRSLRSTNRRSRVSSHRFSSIARDQGIVRNDLFVDGVVTKNAQPTCETAEHGIGDERKRLRRLKWEDRACMTIPQYKYLPQAASDYRSSPFSRSCFR